jgi:hypothetical protein
VVMLPASALRPQCHPQVRISHFAPDTSYKPVPDPSSLQSAQGSLGPSGEGRGRRVLPIFRMRAPPAVKAAVSCAPSRGELAVKHLTTPGPVQLRRW